MSSIILNKMAQLKLQGMLRTYQSLLDSRQHHDLTHDELINTLVQAEWEDREHKKVTRHLRLAKFRYAASIEELNFVSSRGLDKTQVLRLADGSFIDKKENICRFLTMFTHHSWMFTHLVQVSFLHVHPGGGVQFVCHSCMITHP